MSANVEIKLKLSDQASAGLKAASKQVQLAAAQAAQSNERMATKSASAFARMSRARETLGVRSEHSIQREIQRTEAAFNRMTRAGVASARELARAQDASLKKVKQLKDEMKGANGGGRNMLTGAALAAGAYSTYAATKNAYEQNLSLDERLGLRANAAYRGKSVEEKRAGEAKMRDGIKSAVAGGLTSDEAMSTLDELIAKNQVGGVDNAIALLPKVAKFKAGQGGSPVEAASLISTLMGGDNPFAKDINQAMRQLDMIAAAGGAGAFETDDLAKHLPNLLALAKTQGYVGDAGLKRVLVMLEQGMTTAGSADESANNLKNLFSKMNAGDTANDFKKMGRGDLADTMLKARAAGKTPDEVYLEVIAQETKNNPKLRAAMKAVAQAKDETEREERIKAVNELAKGQAIGKLFQDMQAKGAFLALLNEAFGKEVAAAIDKSSGIVDKDAAYMQEKTGFKKRVSDESKKLAELELVDKLNPVMNAYYEATTQLATAVPLLSGATTLATGALTALAASAWLNVPGAGGKLLSGGKAVLGGAGRLAATAGGALFSTSGAAVLGAGAVGYGVGTLANYGIDKGLSAMTGKDTNLGAWLYDVLHSDAIGKAADPAKVQTEVVIKAAPEFRVQSQTTSTSGPVKNFMHTGSIWGTP